MATTSRVASERITVIALHCSGSGGRAWDRLRQSLGPTAEMITPDFIGTSGRPHWDGSAWFRLAHEATDVVAAIDRVHGPVHLVGHSYGGGVALRVVQERPQRVASLALYEPTCFWLLGAMGQEGRAARREILAVANDVARDVVHGTLRDASRRFVDYWNSAGTFETLRPQVQDEIMRYVAKAPLEFTALLHERITPATIRALRIPVLIMRGEHAPMPTALIAHGLAVALAAELVIVPGAGHMGPFTHADAVNRAIAGHLGIADCNAASRAA
jgi:pimeloyl-ACP methyl ester carboxylesterase